MFKFYAMYKRPADEAAFFKYYNDVHIPLVRKVPGLKGAVVNRIVGSPMGGEAPYFLIAELHFADKAAFDAASRTPEFQATGADVANFAKGLLTVMVAEEI